MTSHAAVVARGMGKCCVAGAGDCIMDYKNKTLSVGKTVVKEGEWVSLNGSTGVIYKGQVATVEPKLTGPFGVIMKLADKYRTLGVRTNADTPHDTEVAVKFGAEGIGLTRTEHMFFEGGRIVSFRRLILVAETVKRLRQEVDAATDDKARKILEKRLAKPLKQYNQALAELLPLQRKDFEGIFKALKGRPCTVRLLDPPLHEFLPHDEAGQKEMAKTMKVKYEDIKNTVESLHEFNPMLGHRGCRLGLSYPEVTAMQVRAIVEAAIKVKGSKPEIMIPLVGAVKELALQKQVALDTIDAIMKEKKLKKLPFPLMIGTMIEVPPRRGDGRRDRQGSAVLQLRHQRPHADGLRLQPRRPPASSSATTSATASMSTTPSRCSIRRAWDGWWNWPSKADAAPGPILSSASAASTAANRSPSSSATRSASTTCRAAPSACRSPASPPRRPRSSPASAAATAKSPPRRPARRRRRRPRSNQRFHASNAWKRAAPFRAALFLNAPAAVWCAPWTILKPKRNASSGRRWACCFSPMRPGISTPCSAARCCPFCGSGWG